MWEVMYEHNILRADVLKRNRFKRKVVDWMVGGIFLVVSRYSSVEQ